MMKVQVSAFCLSFLKIAIIWHDELIEISL